MNKIITGNKVLSTAIVGAKGYAGLVLAQLIEAHPQLSLSGVFNRDEAWHLSHDLPYLAFDNVAHFTLENLQEQAKSYDVIFLATPTTVSMTLAPILLKQNNIVIDLSGAFRLLKNEYEHWYQEEHTASELIESAQYGLCPWLKTKANFIANPGCYATCALMALLPILTKQLIFPNDIIIDAKSGASGAGRTAKQNLLFCEIMNDFTPYKIGEHQHIPEINHTLFQYTRTKTNISMMTHLLPIKRGISMTIYTKLKGGVDAGSVMEAYASAYCDYPLVKVHNLDDAQSGNHKTYLSLSSVVGTAGVHVSYKVMGEQLVVFATLDNLLKGAASQAIENINNVMGLPLETGLLQLGGAL